MRRRTLALLLTATVGLGACGDDEQAVTPPAATTTGGEVDVTASDSATNTIAQQLAADAARGTPPRTADGAPQDDQSTLASQGNRDSLSTTFNFFRAVYQRHFEEACGFVEPAAGRALAAGLRPSLGATDCATAVAAFAGFAGDAVIADLLETDRDGKTVSARATIHAPGRRSLHLSLKPTRGGWRITTFGNAS